MSGKESGATQLAKQFIIDRNLAFTTQRKEERFVDQFIAVSDAAPKCEGLDAVLEHIALHLLRNCTTGDYSIDVEEACKAWPQYSEIVKAWDVLGSEQPQCESDCDRSSSSTSTTTSWESSEWEIVNMLRESRSADDNDETSSSSSTHNSNPFNLFQKKLKGLEVPRETMSAMYVMWKLACGSTTFSTMSDQEIDESLLFFAKTHFAIAMLDRAAVTVPTNTDRRTFEQVLVDDLAGNVVFSSEHAKEVLLVDWCALLRTTPQYESLQAVASLFVSNLRPKSGCDPRFLLDKVVWSNWIKSPPRQKQFYIANNETYPKDAQKKENPFKWFQKEIKQRGHCISKPTLSSLYVVFRLWTAGMSDNDMKAQFEVFIKEKFSHLD